MEQEVFGNNGGKWDETRQREREKNGGEKIRVYVNFLFVHRQVLFTARGKPENYRDDIVVHRVHLWPSVRVIFDEWIRLCNAGRRCRYMEMSRILYAGMKHRQERFVGDEQARNLAERARKPAESELLSSGWIISSLGNAIFGRDLVVRWSSRFD